MGFLSELTMVQRAGAAGVIILVLVLLLVKQKQKQAATAGGKVAKAKKEKPAKTKSAKGGKKGLSFSKGRKSKKGEDVAPVAEPKSGQGRMVPRLPAAMGAESPGLEPAEFDAAAEPALAEPVATVDASGGMISEPGWPTPGEVWAAPDATATTEFAPVSEPAATYEDGHEPMEALTGATATDSAGWATDGLEAFDPATGWETPADEPAATAQDTAEASSWEKEQEDFDWTATDSWAEPAEDAAEELASAEAAWEAPEEEVTSWTSSDESWDHPVAEAEETPVATAVVDEPEFTVSDWAVPAADVEAEATPEVNEPLETDEAAPIVWDAVAETETVSAEASEAEPVAEVTVEATPEEPVFAPVAEEPHAEEPVVDFAEAPADEPVEEPVAEVADVAEEPVVAGVPAVEAEDVEPAVAVDAEPFTFDAPVFDEHQEFTELVPVVADAEMPAEYGAPMVVAAAAIADPVSRWAAMAPGGLEERVAVDPVTSWSRLRPGKVPAPNGNGGSANGASVATPLAAPAPSDVAIALAPSAAPAVAWWDVPSSIESDPRRGRFALGGYALQPGHQVVSGVTFREGVVPPPSHWVIGPVLGAVAPGTLVLDVDGCLNCRPEDLAVLMDPGFAPTTDGFSLRLAASATGPFAMSGTYVIS